METLDRNFIDFLKLLNYKVLQETPGGNYRWSSDLFHRPGKPAGQQASRRTAEGLG
jgi:hypothetical protein